MLLVSVSDDLIVVCFYDTTFRYDICMSVSESAPLECGIGRIGNGID